VAAALRAHRDGYQVAFVADARGSATAIGHHISLRRLEQQGVALTTTASVSAELTGDYPSTPRSCTADSDQMPTPTGVSRDVIE
jgi:hypothetical protein